MKKLVATLCIVGSALTLAACETTGNNGSADSAAPYSTERTAGATVEREAPVRAERVFRNEQTK